MLIVELCASLEENKLKLLTRSTDYWLKKSHGIYRQIMPDVFVALFSIKIPNDSLWGRLDTIFITLADLSVAYTGARSGAIADELLRSRCRLGSGSNEHKESRIYTVSQKQNTKLVPITSPNINRFSNFLSLMNSVANLQQTLFKYSTTP